MNDLNQTLKAGDLLIIESGEYSDFGSDDPVRVLKDFIKQDAVNRFMAEWTPTSEWSKKPGCGDFLPWLVKSGYVEAVDNCTSWHVGTYGSFEP